MEIKKIESYLNKIEERVKSREKGLRFFRTSLSRINKTLEGFAAEFKKNEEGSLGSLDASTIEKLNEKARGLAGRIVTLYGKSKNVKHLSEGAKGGYDKFLTVSSSMSNVLGIKKSKMTEALKLKLLQGTGSRADIISQLDAVINAYVENEDSSNKEAEDLAKEAVGFIENTDHREVMRKAVIMRLQKEFDDLLQAGDLDAAAEKLKGSRVLRWFSQTQVGSLVSELLEKDLVFSALEIKRQLSREGVGKIADNAFTESSKKHLKQSEMTDELKQNLPQGMGGFADQLDVVINVYVNNKDPSNKEAEGLAKEAVEFIADPAHQIAMRLAVSDRLQKEFDELLQVENLDAAAEKLKGSHVLYWFSQRQVEGLISKLLEKDLVPSALEIKRQLTLDGFEEIADNAFVESAEKYLKQGDLKLASMARDGISDGGDSEGISLDLVRRCFELDQLEEAAVQIGFIDKALAKGEFVWLLVGKYLNMGKVDKAVEFSCSFEVPVFSVKCQLLTEVVDNCLSKGDKAGALSVEALCSQLLSLAQVKKIQAMVATKIKEWEEKQNKIDLD